MNKKWILIAVVVVALVGGLGYYYSGELFQGKFNVSNTYETLNVEEVPTYMKVVPADLSGGRSIISKSTDATERQGLGQWDVTYYEDVIPCKVSFKISDANYNLASAGGFNVLHTPWSDKSTVTTYFDDVMLQVYEDANPTNTTGYVGAYEPEDGYQSEFLPDFTPTAGKTYYFNLYGYVDSHATLIEDEKIYMTNLCVRSDNGVRTWDASNSEGENDYFNVSNNATYGIYGGIELTIQE
jgi:hypothetical protein